jgi:DNA-binding NarL/FixJ family response regulator
MSYHADFNDVLDRPDANNHHAVMEISIHAKVVLLIESRPLMGEIFSHALKEAAHDMDVRIASCLEDVAPDASLAILSFAQRSSDPFYINFVIQQLRSKIGDLPLLVITDSADPAIARIMEDAGVLSWITAPMGFGAVVNAIRQALSFPPFLEMRPLAGPVLMKAPANRPVRIQSERNLHSEIHLSLTDREIDVLTLLQKGKQNKAIAYALNISESTTKVHIRNIMRKFHLRNRTEVALMCGAVVRPPNRTTLSGPNHEDSQMAMPALIY